VNAQIDFFPPGAEWYFSFKTPGLLEARGYTRYAYAGDVEIGGREASQLDLTTYILDYDNPTIPIDTIYEEPLYIVQSGDSILYYTDSVYQLLWRMDVQAGEQFGFSNKWGDIYQMNVDSTKTVIVDNQETVKMWISGGTMYGQWGSTVIYDRFGPVNGFRYYACWGWYDCYDSSLCRYKSDATGVVDFNGYYCDNLLASATDPQPDGIHVYPNPANDALYISCPDDWNESIRINLFDQTGQLVYDRSLPSSQNNTVDLSSFVPGMYYCRVGAQVFKVIKL
jgi:hypothetical protein